MDKAILGYAAGLFDGEGCVTYKQYYEKRKTRPNPAFVWRLKLEIAMTDKETIEHFYNIFKLGSWNPKTITNKKYKPQWRWAASYTAAYKIAKLIVPYAVTKKNKLQEIIDHYDQNEGNKGKNTRKS